MNLDNDIKINQYSIEINDNNEILNNAKKKICIYFNENNNIKMDFIYKIINNYNGKFISFEKGDLIFEI
jgi:hypothetical protein